MTCTLGTKRHSYSKIGDISRKAITENRNVVDCLPLLKSESTKGIFIDDTRSDAYVDCY